MSKIEVNTVAPQCGTTLTLGESGDTVTLGSGASQSGFGRTGTVDWQTGDIKTGTFSATNGEGYFVNTSGATATANLPAGSAGAIVSFADYTSSFSSNKFTISPNGSDKIGGQNISVDLTTDGQSVTLVFVDSTEGWITVNDSSENISTSPFIQATGGTITNSGNCRIHTFTGPGNFVVCVAATCAANNEVSYAIVAGGGGGSTDVGGAGGAGGFRETKTPVTPYTASPLDGYSTPGNRVTVTAQSYPIVVGSGGAGNSYPPGAPGSDGSTSSFAGISAAGGGGGSHVSGTPGRSGGSGGGGYRGGGAAGSGNTPSVTPAQGNNGGAGSPGPGTGGAGGGGGATAVGAIGATDNAPTSGAGGAGATTSINGSPTAYAGGGGGATRTSNFNSTPGGAGGAGGGGAGSGAGPCGVSGGNGTANTGGGGGGATNAPGDGGSGGSGIVIIRYKVG